MHQLFGFDHKIFDARIEHPIIGVQHELFGVEH